MVLRHARPHLEIHTRSKGHSAVAGVAYRLGLRLWDERQQCWHDYTRRSAGEEVVMAMTVAPEGAPPWATDPGQLWNAVELAEKRKDSQVARDYRIPIPLGLDDQRAGQLAERLARFIMSELGTPVSVGLHRDADTDALGQVKPADRQGFHAHLYFPSRPLVIGSAAGDDADTGAAEAATTFGARHPMLASKALGRGLVEILNRVWSELSNEAAADAGLPAAYEYRSYKRMGLDLTPQPTLGADAVALERKGFWTRKGDAIRDIVVASRAYEIAHSEAVAAQEDAARADVARERSAGKRAEPEAGRRPVPDPGQEHAAPAVLAMPGAEGVAGGVWENLGPGAPLVARFQAVSPRPSSPEEVERFGTLLRLVRTIQRALALILGLSDRVTEAEQQAARARSARLEAHYELDQARRARAKATDRAQAWADAHPMRMRAAKLAGRLPRAWRDLAHDITFHRDAVSAIKAIVTAQQAAYQDASGELQRVEHRVSRARGRLERANHTLACEAPTAVAPLLAAMTPDERQVVEPIVAGLVAQDTPPTPVVEPVLVYRPPGLRPRP